MTIPTKVDHTEIGLNRLPTQFDEKDNLRTFLSVYLNKMEDLEDMFLQLLNERHLAVAVGFQLDVIGALVGESRQSRADPEYREAIYTRIFINNSEGTPEDVMDALKIFTQGTYANIWEHYPAGVHLFTNGSVIPDTLISTMQTIVPAACGVVRVMYGDKDDVLIPCELDENRQPTGNFQQGVLAEIISTDLEITIDGLNYEPLEITALLPGEIAIGASIDSFVADEVGASTDGITVDEVGTELLIPQDTTLEVYGATDDEYILNKILVEEVRLVGVSNDGVVEDTLGASSDGIIVDEVGAYVSYVETVPSYPVQNRTYSLVEIV